MKKVLSILLVIFIVFIVLPVKAQVWYPIVSVTGSSVNVRNGPSLNYNVQYQVSMGTLLEKISQVHSSSGDLWYKVYDFNKNKVVYIASWLTKDSGVSIYGENADFIAEVNADVLNTRIGPGTSFRVIDVLSKGDEVHITRIVARSDGQKWFRYKKGNQYYYVAGWYMQKVEPKKTDENGNKKEDNTQNPVATANYYINLRKGPSLDYGKLGLISKGDTVSVEGSAKNKEGETWIEVNYKGITGWCYSPLFTVSNLSIPDVSPIGGNGITADYVNLRSGPSTSYDIEKVLNKGTNCNIEGVARNKKGEIWYEVSAGNDGWIRSDLLTLHTEKKGQISKITWEIASNGINIVVYGNSINKPSISVLENPIRIEARFSNDILSKNASALLIGISPIIRVRFDQQGLTTVVTVDLTDRIPFKADFKDGKFVINLELPKKGEKRVEVSDSLVYAPIVLYNNTEFVELSSVLDSFGAKYSFSDSGVHIELLSDKFGIPMSDLLKKDGDIYISLGNLMKYFKVVVSESGNTIYADPTLLSYKKSDSTEKLDFSLPPKIKKVENNGKTQYIIYADASNYKDKLNFTERSGANPPKIVINTNSISVSGAKVVLNGSKPVNKGGVLSGRIIVIDPGHGSYSGPYLDTGATGPTGVKEGAVVLEIAKRLKALLEKDGATVILTHDTLDNPNNPTLAQRCAIANNSGGDLFMSIHLNASVSREAHGTETYYWHSDSLKFAEAIQHSLVTELGTTDRGVKRDYLYVCRNVTTMPAILAEVVFVSNPHEEALCKQSTFLDKVAKAFEDGIIKYLTNGG